jgi:hypothetical protein
MRELGSDASPASGRPRVLFDPIPLTHAGQRVDLTAHVTTGGAGARAKITDARMSLFDHSATVGGVPIPLTSAGPGLYRGTLTAVKAGNYDVVFEAAVEGPNLRAVRELTVVE